MDRDILDGWFLCLVCGRFWSCERVVDGNPIIVKIDDREMDKAFHRLTAEEQLDMVSTCPECNEKRDWRMKSEQ